MWRTTPRFAIATLTATLALAVAPEAGAASVQTYAGQATGNISGSDSGPITFSPRSYPTPFTTPGTIQLGDFITNPLPSTATLTYDNTPFAINLAVGADSGFAHPAAGFGPDPSTYQYQITGRLSGSIGGDGSTSMTATVTSITGSGPGATTSPPFPIADLVISPQGIAAPVGNDAGITALTGQVLVAGLPIPSSLGPGDPTPAPEPSTIAVLGLALAGWACRRGPRSRAGRARA